MQAIVMHRRQAMSRASPALTRHRLLPRRAPGGSSGLPTLHLPRRRGARPRSPPARRRPPPPAAAPPHAATAGFLAALGPASRPAGSAPPSPAPPAQADAPHPPALAVEPRDPVETAGALRPAPLTS